MFRVQSPKIPSVLQHADSKAGFREKEKLGQGHTKYVSDTSVAEI